MVLYVLVWSFKVMSGPLLSKPNVTQLNSTQLKQLKSNFVGLDTVATWNPPPPPHTNLSVTSRPPRKLKFCTDTH